MKKTKIKSFDELNILFGKYDRGSFLRGVSNHAHKLIPAISRRNLDENILKKNEENLMLLFKSLAKTYIKFTPKSEIEWLMMAQHHGLPTRLLDWTLNPLVATFFSVNKDKDKDKDGALYVYPSGIRVVFPDSMNVEKLNKVEFIFPTYDTKRIIAQSGTFSIHPLQNLELKNKNIEMIIIPKSLKRNFMERLQKYGVHYASLFPDLDGVSNHIKWLRGYDF